MSTRVCAQNPAGSNGPLSRSAPIRRLVIALSCLGAFAALSIAPARAAAQSPGEVESRPTVDVVEVSGLIDPVIADFLDQAVTAAERAGSHALVIQLDSGGSVLAQDRLLRLTERLQGAAVPVAVWVGPAGARARGGSINIVQAADVAGRAPGTSIDLDGQSASRLLQAPVLGVFLLELDGRRAKGRILSTAESSTPGGPGAAPSKELVVRPRFAKLPGLARLLHTAASPSVAYLLLLGALVLVVFELFTAGIGIAAAVAAPMLVLAGYGLDVLPARGWAVAALVAGIIGYAIDVQAGAPRAWTVIGTALVVLGTGRLYAGPGVSLSALSATVGVGGVALAMVAGMPAMVRARFATPTIGRESMVGETGEAVTDVAPDGTVTIDGAPWRARTNRATPIDAGGGVRVVAIDGLVLEVEPVEGGARDYRR